MNFNAPGTSTYTDGGMGINGDVDALYLRYSLSLCEKCNKHYNMMNAKMDSEMFLLITYSRYFSSDDFSRSGMPDRNSIINVVNMGDSIPIHSKPLITFNDITKMPHQMTISPK